MTETVEKAVDEKFCSECGSIIKAKVEICPKCGVRQSAPPPAPSPGVVAANGRNKLVAALLAIFLGGLGIHKFYLGQTGWGILYLVFCWTFIPAFVGLIEGILFLVMSQDDFNRKYGGV